MIHPSLWHLSSVIPFMIAVGSYKPGPDMMGRFMYLGHKSYVIFIDRMNIPMNMIGNERSIQKNGEPLASKEEEDVDENVEDVLWQD